MKKLASSYILMFSLNAFSSIYVEGDVLHPLLNVTDRTNESSLDLRAGYLFNEWDISFRYYQVRGISYSGGYSGSTNISVSDAEDTYASIRAGYRIGSFTIGAGVGPYNRDFETSLGANDNKNYGKNVLGLEAFVSYKWTMGSFFIKPEVNFVTANVPTSASRVDGSNSYNVDYN